MCGISAIFFAILCGVSVAYNNGVRSHLEDITGIANWDVSAVNEMRYMFQYTEQLADTSSIKNWDVSGVSVTGTGSNNHFQGMFKNSAATPVPFTLRPGTWNDGTYTPSS